MGEPQNENDLFFVCSFIEYIARKTNNKKSYIVKKIGKELLQKIYNLAEVYHSENIEKVSDEIIEQSKIVEKSISVLSCFCIKAFAKPLSMNILDKEINIINIPISP